MQVPLADSALQRQLGGRALSHTHRCLPGCSRPQAPARACPVWQRRTVGSRRSLATTAATAVDPPPVSATKSKFYDAYRRPMNAIYNTVVQELLVQQHIIRHNRKYQYDEVFALGFVSIFDQILEGLPADKDAIFSAYIKALDEDPAKYRADASKLEQWASGISDPAELAPSSEGNDEVRQSLAKIAQRAEAGDFLYSRFFAVGLFRMLELSKAKDPQALQGLVKAMHVRQDSVNRDLMTYKGLLSKLSAAKEMLQEYTARERKKQQEREAAKAEAAKPKEESKESAKEAEKEPAKV